MMSSELELYRSLVLGIRAELGFVLKNNNIWFLFRSRDSRVEGHQQGNNNHAVQ